MVSKPCKTNWLTELGMTEGKRINNTHKNCSRDDPDEGDLGGNYGCVVHLKQSSFIFDCVLIGDHGWHIHDFPVDQTVDPAVQCLGGSVGGHYDPLNRSAEPDDPGYADRCRDDMLQ